MVYNITGANLLFAVSIIMWAGCVPLKSALLSQIKTIPISIAHQIPYFPAFDINKKKKRERRNKKQETPNAMFPALLSSGTHYYTHPTTIKLPFQTPATIPFPPTNPLLSLLMTEHPQAQPPSAQQQQGHPHQPSDPQPCPRPYCSSSTSK